MQRISPYTESRWHPVSGEDCCIIDTTKITINPALGNGAQILAADGVNVCELVLKDSEGLTLTTWDFHINVLKRVHNGENLRSSDAYDILDKIDRDEKIRKENESARIEAEQTRKTSETQGRQMKPYESMRRKPVKQPKPNGRKTLQRQLQMPKKQQRNVLRSIMRQKAGHMAEPESGRKKTPTTANTGVNSPKTMPTAGKVPCCQKES